MCVRTCRSRENEPVMGQIDDEQSRRHPQAPLAPHGPSRAPPCRPTPSLHLTLARALTAQLTAVLSVPQVRSQAHGDPPQVQGRLKVANERSLRHLHPHPRPWRPAATRSRGPLCTAAARACFCVLFHVCVLICTNFPRWLRPCPTCSLVSLVSVHPKQLFRTVGLRVGSSVRSAPYSGEILYITLNK